MEIQTQGGGINDPRWSHNGGKWATDPSMLKEIGQQKPPKAPTDLSKFKDASGNPYAAFSVPQGATPVTTPQSNTVFARAWNQARPKDAPEAQSFTMPGYNYTRKLNPLAGTATERKMTEPGNQGNLAYAYERPKFFEQRAKDFTGAQSETPDYDRRDAFIDLLNRRLSQYQRDPTGNMGTPTFDIPSMWNQAADDVKRGFSNPLRMSPR